MYKTVKMIEAVLTQPFKIEIHLESTDRTLMRIHWINQNFNLDTILSEDWNLTEHLEYIQKVEKRILREDARQLEQGKRLANWTDSLIYKEGQKIINSDNKLLQVTDTSTSEDL